MGGRRGIAALIAGLIVVAACGIGALLLVRSTLDDAIKVLGLVGTTLGVLTVVWAVLNWLWRHGRPDEVHRPTAEQIDELATTVRNQWKNEANRRKLLAPAPLPIRWALAAAELRGSVDGVIGVPGQPRRFSPVPGLQDVTKQMLRAGGGQTDLHHIYGGVASGRLVITGEPGAGKTAAAIMLLLDALAHRTRLSEVERAQVPVPVMFTLADWDPNVVSFEAWIAETLAATYYSGNAGRQQARMLVDDCRVAAIVDGLDEINADLRPVALEAMSAAKIRVVLLSRSEELTIAAREHRLMDAAVLELCPVGPRKPLTISNDPYRASHLRTGTISYTASAPIPTAPWPIRFEQRWRSPSSATPIAPETT